MARLCGLPASSSNTARDASPGLPDDALPVYTVIAALYREAASVDGLLSAIERLDYPAEKLDVIVAVEADDRDTRAAIAARNSSHTDHRDPGSDEGPRTKPKALNVALPFARGTFTVIYDAEDRPEPNQLRHALQAFAPAVTILRLRAGAAVHRQYRRRLAGPAVHRLNMPASSTYSCPDWPPCVCRSRSAARPIISTPRPCAKLAAGILTTSPRMPISACGWRASAADQDVIDSTTYEEAPAQFGPWLRQRTRWFKGWMQTWLVHMRQPGRLLRDLGPTGFFTFQLIVGGNVLAALVHPLFMAALIYSGSGAPMWRGDARASPSWLRSTARRSSSAI